ncbi:MAG: transcriptional regulator [Rikenellaceae bacterium]|jgi:DNA-binding HxlR family transcriptional regulator|nr:transcriptional regulator [Rikenellaceae bacterium]
MASLIANLNKVFDSRIRLGIMSILSVNTDADFNEMKQMMELTDGNLASHLRALENEGYLRSMKRFIGRKPNTSYAITPAGRRAFQNHIDALERLTR